MTSRECLGCELALLFRCGFWNPRGRSRGVTSGGGLSGLPLPPSSLLCAGEMVLSRRQRTKVMWQTHLQCGDCPRADSLRCTQHKQPAYLHLLHMLCDLEFGELALQGTCLCGGFVAFVRL